MNAKSNPTVAVVGAGPAGVSAAFWLDKLGIPNVWVSVGAFGGTLNTVFNPISDWPTQSYTSGQDAIAALEAWSTRRPTLCRVESIRPSSQWTLNLDDSSSIEVQHVILATGTRRRDPQIPGVSKAMSRVFYSTSRAPQMYANQDVAVIGGGDGAMEGAFNLADAGARVDVYARSAISARVSLAAQAQSHPKINILPVPGVIESIRTDPKGCFITSNERVRRYDAICLKLGVSPLIPGFDGEGPLLDSGYIRVDANQKTQLEGVWAAGDVTNVRPQSLATACGSGIRAAAAIATILRRAQ